MLAQPASEQRFSCLRSARYIGKAPGQAGIRFVIVIYAGLTSLPSHITVVEVGHDTVIFRMTQLSRIHRSIYLINLGTAT